MKTPSVEDIERSVDIRKRSKRGEHVSPKDLRWNTKIFNRFPEWYNQTEGRVFNETVPFGSAARWKEKPCQR